MLHYMWAGLLLRGLKRSGVALPLCSSRACVPTALIAVSVHCVSDWPANVPLALGSPPGALECRVGSGTACQRGGGGGS